MILFDKIITPNIDFKEINSNMYPQFLKENLEKIKNLFTDENVDHTLQEINKIIIQDGNKIINKNSF